MLGNVAGRVPILLLKTKSSPVDTYEEFFLTFDENRYRPIFVPVLEHRFKQDALDQVRESILNSDFADGGNGSVPKYGALIFTSQRAVEAFAQIIEKIRAVHGHALDSYLPTSVPLYVVGPATARALRALDLPCPILGEETGNGDNLSSFILAHYNRLHTTADKPAILFLVGEKRRDIIPRALQSQDLAAVTRLTVDELEIYETGEMQAFKAEFSSLCKQHAEAGVNRQWIVVFSPTGCQAMLASLSLLDAYTGKAIANRGPRRSFVATIGPTTRDYLLKEFDFVPDVCADRPSPEGIAAGIQSFGASDD